LILLSRRDTCPRCGHAAGEHQQWQAELARGAISSEEEAPDELEEEEEEAPDELEEEEAPGVELETSQRQAHAPASPASPASSSAHAGGELDGLRTRLSASTLRDAANELRLIVAVLEDVTRALDDSRR